MGSLTPVFAFPYPIGSDRVRDGDNAIQALAERVEAVLEPQLFPVGVILPYGGAAAPAGWVLAQGQLVSRTGATAALFLVFGTTYGAGDGSTTFALPDLRSRVPVGAGQGAGLRDRARGSAGGGEDTVASHGHSTGNESADHAHGINADGNHAHTLYLSDSGGLGGGGTLVRKGGQGTNASEAAGNHAHGGGTGGRNAAHTHTVNAAGQADGNLPPFLVLQYIIRL